MRPTERSVAWFDRDTAVRLAWISGLFSLVVTSGLLWQGLSVRPMLYFDDPAFLEIKQGLVENPADEEARQTFRGEDLARRQAYFESRSKLQFGSWLLFGGGLVFVLSMRRLAALREILPVPLDPLLLENPKKEEAGRLVALLALPLPVAAGVLAAFLVYTPTGTSADQTTSLLAGPPPELPESERWIQFRGNGTLGTSPAMELPASWNAESGEHILWKSPIPLKGNSSPIVWGNRAFLTGADQESRKVLCYDLANGSVAWERNLWTAAVIDEEMKKSARTTDTGFASPTAATDGRLVFVFFGTNELAAFDYEGNQIWARWFGKPNSLYGIATSPRYYNGKVFLQLDQGDEDAPESFLYAINPVDGNILWKTPRPVPASWTCPIVVDTPSGAQLIAAGSPWVISYDPETGKENWRADVLKGDVAPLPAYCDGMVYTAVEYSQLAAVRVDGQGDVTQSHVAWTYEDNMPDVPSPVCDGKRLLLATSSGDLACLNATDGKEIWTDRLDGEFWSSPTLVGDRIYFPSKEGQVFIFKLGDTFTLEATAELGEKITTSPAFIQNRILIRGENHLFLIGAAPWPS